MTDQTAETLNTQEERQLRTGYINQAGQLIVVLPKDSLLPQGFREGLLSITLRPGEELIGSDGQLLVQATEYENYVSYFVDLNGELAFGGRYFFDAKHFSEGLAAVQLPSQIEGSNEEYLLYGYIDHSGHTVVKPQFRNAENFSEGLAAVQLAREDFSQRYWGYIDRKGEFLVEPRFSSARSFSAGLAVVSVNGRYGYIDHSGKIVIEPQFDEAEDFIHGRDWAVVGVGGYWGCIDRTGKFVVEPSLDWIEDRESLRMVRMGATKDSTYPYKGYEYHAELEGGQYSFMNSAGKLIIPPVDYDEHWDNFFRVNYQTTTLQIKVDGKWGCMDETGAFIIPPHFEDLGASQDGLVTFSQEGLWGLLNLQGEVIIPAKFEALGIWGGNLFSEGLMPACLKGRWGYIDLSGEFVIAPEFEYVGDFSEGLAIVVTKSYCGFIDRSGLIVIPCKFEMADDFYSNGLAVAYAAGHKGNFINRVGEWIAPPRFDMVYEFENGAAEVQISLDQLNHNVG
jgi:hypothetical protein